MTRRFRLRPIQLQPGGFTQTIVLPPAVRPGPREQSPPDPGGGCEGVPPPPDGVAVWGSTDQCGEGEVLWFLAEDNPLPAGYTSQSPVCLSSELEGPASWEITRDCDGAVFAITVTNRIIVCC